MNRFWLACTFLFGIFSISAQVGDSLYSLGHYEDAALAYEFEYFYHREDSSLLKKAWVNKLAGHYQQAIKDLKRVNTIDVNYDLALLYYLQGDLSLSYSQLLRLELLQTGMLYEQAILKELVLLARNRFSEAKSHLQLYGDLLHLTKEEIDALFPKKLKVKVPDRAYNVSLILPGFGQAYAGYPGRGFISGAMNLGSVGYTYWSLINRYYYSGVLTGAALFYTFYLGGARYAKNLATEKNEALADELILKFQKAIKKPD